MSDIVMYLVAFLGVGLIVYMLIKKMDIKISLFFVGLIFMYISLYFGDGIALKGFTSSGVIALDPIKAIVEKFKSTISSAGFIILILGGYSAYMSSIKANDATVALLLKPISLIKSPFLLAPVIFLIGNLLSLVVPSASNLAIIMLATLYPIMIKAGMSKLSAAATVATTATIIPTPLGSDNVAVAEELAKNLERFATMSVSDYVFTYHAMVSIPTIIFMAVVHYFWQKYCDKKEGGETIEKDENAKELRLDFSPFTKIVYAILPLLPIILLIGLYFFSTNKNIKIEIVVLISFIISIVCDIVKNRSFKIALDNTGGFFKGMGDAMPIVALLVAGMIFVLGLQSLGVIKAIQTSMATLKGGGMDFILPLALVAFTALIVILSGSGVALFYAMIPLFIPLSEAANIDVLAISIPMGLAGNLLRAVSPVSAVVMIVAGTTKTLPFAVVKRTAIPMVAGTIFMFILSMVLYL